MPKEIEWEAAGHRDRLRKRYLVGGAEPLPDYELLELLLYAAIPRRDIKPLTKTLLKTFGDFAGVIAASQSELASHGLSEASLVQIKIVKDAAQRLLRQPLHKKPILANWPLVMDYCIAAMSHEPREQLRLLFLDAKNCLIADEIQQIGTVNHTAVYPREVIHRTLDIGASAVILVHNHPSGDSKPSQADIDMTRTLAAAASSIGIRVHDHVIVAGGTALSMKSLGLF